MEDSRLTDLKFMRDGYPTAVLDSREACAYLNVAASTLYRWVRDGKLPHLRIGPRIKFRVSDLDTFLEQRVTTTWKRHEKKRGWKPESDPMIREAIAAGVLAPEDFEASDQSDGEEAEGTRPETA